jgi:hypothetical protein
LLAGLGVSDQEKAKEKEAEERRNRLLNFKKVRENFQKQ